MISNNLLFCIVNFLTVFFHKSSPLLLFDYNNVCLLMFQDALLSFLAKTVLNIFLIPQLNGRLHLLNYLNLLPTGIITANWHLVSNTPKGKKDALKATAYQSKHYKQKSKRTVSFQNVGQTAIQNKIFTRTCIKDIQ